MKSRQAKNLSILYSLRLKVLSDFGILYSGMYINKGAFFSHMKTNLKRLPLHHSKSFSSSFIKHKSQKYGSRFPSDKLEDELSEFLLPAHSIIPSDEILFSKYLPQITRLKYVSPLDLVRAPTAPTVSTAPTNPTNPTNSETPEELPSYVAYLQRQYKDENKIKCIYIAVIENAYWEYHLCEVYPTNNFPKTHVFRRNKNELGWEDLTGDDSIEELEDLFDNWKKTISKVTKEYLNI